MHVLNMLVRVYLVNVRVHRYLCFIIILSKLGDRKMKETEKN